MKSGILKMLRESSSRGQFVSGQELCDHFGVSRTAVWKAVESLKAEGYKVEAVRNKGYRILEEPEDAYDEASLRSLLETNRLGKTLRFYRETDSTNLCVKREAEEGAEEGLLVAADLQSAGRGRRGRTWVSPPGANVYFSLLLRPRIEPDKAPMLTILMGMAVCLALDDLDVMKTPVGIKWPNDIVADGRKICGMLTEMSVETGFVQYVVIGVGINVRKQEFAPEIAQVAAAMEEFTDSPVSRSKLVARVIARFEELYERFLREGDLGFLRRSYHEKMVSAGKQVRVLDPQGEYEGTARGINENGELLVELPGGEIREVYAGEVSVRGIYGYV